ncbi:LuxR C-terminal-related transcriptional regulator [Clostridium sp.]|uniref:helix-turn-helix transcriptional regulator n=1 Tax=Clostridium sp. TaxID=1506 RepID=UPI00284F7B35|nr:LuxR C-terminal-related transcriptional regulator [Clostridium sp.]MDR3593518.1 LuxR C-terminal-related transcriptional regulator [Clostridium sp.]
MRDKIFRPKILHRKRINKILSQIFDVPIFFIAASIGFGKTISVKSFLEKKIGIQIIWFDTPNEDSDDEWMWHKFCEVIKSTNSNLGKNLSAYGFPKTNMDVYKIIDAIRNQIKQKTVFVIDDWYDLKTNHINYLIKVIALEKISNLHIVIISRNKPSNQYIELELKQKCLVMRQDDIAYTLDETVEFFEINGITLTDEEKGKVYEYTGGWTSATYLSLLQYNNERTFDNIPRATKLIKIAVYDKFDEMTKQILLKLAPLNNFTLEQASFITENEKSRDVIQELVSNNCFIKYDINTKIYTLHAILRSALREEILSLNIDINKINNTCGDWYYKDLRDIDAIEYYYKAKNFDRVLDIIERNDTIKLTNLWKKIVGPVVEQLSMEQKVSRPIAYLTYIFFYILYGNSVKGKELLYDLWVIYEVNDDLKDRNQILAEIAFIESVTMFGDVKKMIQYHKKAYDLLQGNTSKIANNRMPVTLGSPHMLCIFHENKGEFKSLMEYLKKNIMYFIQISNGGAEGSDYLMSAEYYFETGDSQNAELFAYKALHKSKLKNQTSIAICALFLLMRICVNKNDKWEIRNKYDSLIKEYKNLEIPRFLNGTELALGYIDAITGNLKNMLNWIQEIEDLNLQGLSPFMNIKYVISAFAMVLKKSYIELEIHVEIMLETFLKKRNIFIILYAYMFDSIAKYNLYGINSAKKSLHKAIDYAKEDNIIMPFVELSPHILPIIKELEKEDDYTKILLPKCEEFNEIYNQNYCQVDQVELTPRELEVMKLVYEGNKQVEISEKLNIALVTVKKHIASVYVKLNVKNKTTAINLLKEKGIL